MAGEIGFLRVLSFAAGRWRRQGGRLGIAVGLMLAGSCAEILMPTLLSDVFDSAAARADPHAIAAAAGLLFADYFAVILFGTAGRLLYNTAETWIFSDLMRDAFRHVLSLPEAFHAGGFVGGLLNNIKRGRDRLETFEDQVLHVLLPTGAILVGNIAFLALRMPWIAAWLAAYLTAIAFLTALLVVRYAGPSQGANARVQDKVGARLADTVSNVLAVKAFAREDHEAAAFDALCEEQRIATLRAYHRSNIVSFVQNAALGGMLVLLLGSGLLAVVEGSAGPGDLAYLMMAHTIIQSYLREVADSMKTLLNASYELHGAIALLDEKGWLPEPEGAPDLTVPAGGISVQGVGYRHPSKAVPLFSGLDAEILPGERVALVGASGSGKTTFLRLLQRTVDPDSGRILFDGQDLRSVSHASLRRSIAVVPQEPALFHRSLRENIAYARPAATEDEVDSAARKARLGSLLDGLSSGLDTLVGERGMKLSGGERQRVALARAFLADRPFLFLDEATSALDSENEHLIHEALEDLMRGRTTITVAHRLSTILAADRILVFEDGRILEQGSHPALLAAGGAYAALHRRQTEGLIA